MPEHVFADITVRAAKRFGDPRFLLRLVAAEIPDAWIAGMKVERGGPHLQASASHQCGPDCGLTSDTCVTAMKMEEALWRTEGQFMDTIGIEVSGGTLICTLEPLAARHNLGRPVTRA